MNQDHTYCTVGENRGKKRIWLQGGPLEKRGFVKGTTYRRQIDTEAGTVRLVADPRGRYVVSGKPRANGAFDPVVDISNNELAEVTGDADQVRVDFDDGQITISVNRLVTQQQKREVAFREHAKANMLSEGTLCVGGGMATLAMHEGFARHGIEMRTDWIMDREPAYLQVAMDNNPAITPATRIFTGRLEEIEPNLVSAVDVCQFSLSCTGHSKSGKSKNKIAHAESHPSDATGMYGLMRLLDSINAAVYCSENVVEAMGSATYALIRGALQVLGYNVYETVLDSEQSGSFEHRQRYWMIAVSAGLPQPDLANIPHYPRQYQRLGELLDPVPHDDPSWSDNDYLKIKAIKDAAAGKNFKRQLVDENATRVGVINRHYAKRQSTPPMVVRPGVDDKERLLTLSEQARCKGCDPSLVAGATFTTGTEILGQGIDMGQGRGIAELVATDIVAPAAGRPVKLTPLSVAVVSQAGTEVDSDNEPDHEGDQIPLFAS